MEKILLSGMENILLSESKFILSQVIYMVGHQAEFFYFMTKGTVSENFLQILNWQISYEMQPSFLLCDQGKSSGSPA